MKRSQPKTPASLSPSKTPTQLRKERNKYTGLDPSLHPKTRQELFDQDYIDKLSDDEKAWLSKFNDEWTGASLEKASEPENWHKNHHSTKALRKDVTDKNNSRNRDLYSQARTQGWIAPLEDNVEAVDKLKITQPSTTEDALIHELDKKKVFIKKYKDKFCNEEESSS